MKSLLLTLMLMGSLLISCSNIHKEERYVYHLENRVAEKIRQQECLTLDGKGISWPKDITCLYMIFHSDKQVNIQEARMIFVNAAEQVLSEVNSDLKIRSNLYKYPFDDKDIEMSIGFSDCNHIHFNPPYMAHVFNVRGTIYYQIESPVTSNFETVHSEPYQEALKIVREGRKN